jgi:hypothetical protein
MKKISTLILAAILACSGIVAQTPATSSDNTEVGQLPDSIEATTNQAVVYDLASLDESEPQAVPTLTISDGKWSIHFGDEQFCISDLISHSKLADKLEGLSDLEGIDADTFIMKDNMGLITIMVALVFGIPCIAIVVALRVILTYVLKRNKSRNELINNAIDHDYQLPDSFYLSQKNQVGPNSGVPPRDSRKFYSAITFIAFGVGFIVFAIAVDGAFFYLVGAIPLFIGIGNLIGYFCIPNNPEPPRRQPYMYQQPMSYPQPQQPDPQQQPCQPGQPCQQQTPPPYNPS